MKKLIVTLLTLALVLGLATSVFAAEAVKVTPNETGVFTGIPTNAEDVKYLSDTDYVALIGFPEEKFAKDAPAPSSGGVYVYTAPSSQSGNRWVVKNQQYDKVDGSGKTEAGYREFQVGDKLVTFYYNSIYLGGLGQKFDKGVSMQVPKGAGPAELVYSVNGADRFYAVAGGTGDASTRFEGNFMLNYEIWGSKADTYSETAEFERLAYAEQVLGWGTAEFDIDVSEYKFIKLVAKFPEGAAAGGTYYSSWGNACLYSVPAAGGDNPPATADTFTGMIVALFVLSAGAVVTLISNRKRFN